VCSTSFDRVKPAAVGKKCNLAVREHLGHPLYSQAEDVSATRGARSIEPRRNPNEVKARLDTSGKLTGMGAT
jgi:hypothetical protein